MLGGRGGGRGQGGQGGRGGEGEDGNSVFRGHGFYYKDAAPSCAHAIHLAISNANKVFHLLTHLTHLSHLLPSSSCRKKKRLGEKTSAIDPGIPRCPAERSRMREGQDGASQRSPSLLLYIAVQESWKGFDTQYIYGGGVVGGNGS